MEVSLVGGWGEEEASATEYKSFNGTNKSKCRYEVELTKSDISHVRIRKFIKMEDETPNKIP